MWIPAEARDGFLTVSHADAGTEINPMNEELKAMFDCLARGKAAYLPSKFWEKLNTKNLGQLDDEGIGNFKRTIATNYFTWVVGILDPQFRYLIRKMKITDWPRLLKGVFTIDESSSLPRIRQVELSLFTRMLWTLAERTDSLGLMAEIEEPALGNPFKIHLGGKLISQDIANSLLEFYSIREVFSPPRSERFTIAELGAGYGRTAHVFLKAFPRCRYIIVDIPPALYVAQNYLTRIFPKRKAFRFRAFQEIGEVITEMDTSDIVFLLPHQAEMLEKNAVHLFINISSLHEMTRDQIALYLKMIDRLTDGYFYTKQWKVSVNPFDKISIHFNDYPIPDGWVELYLRTPRVQVSFFEAIYRIPGLA